MNLFASLVRDQRALLELLDRARRTSVRARAARSLLLEKARSVFESCAKTEETELLPVLRAQSPGDEARRAPRLVESAGELTVARHMFDELGDMDPSDPRWIARLMQLIQHIERLIAHDQRALFPLAKRIMAAPRRVEGDRRYTVRRRRDDDDRMPRDPIASLWV